MEWKLKFLKKLIYMKSKRKKRKLLKISHIRIKRGERINPVLRKWITQVIIILITSLSTVLFTQLFHEKNVVTESMINMYFKQMHIYNRVHSIWLYDSLMHRTFKAPTMKRSVTIEKDQFGNIVGKHEEQSDSVKWDIVNAKAPSFMFMDTHYDSFMQDWQYVVNHQNEVTPHTYKYIRKLSELLEKHPLPSKNERVKYILSDWGTERVYNQYYSIMEELYNALKIDMDVYWHNNNDN